MLNGLTPERKTVLELHEKGLTPREIAYLLQLSTQRVYQQLSKLGLKPNPRRAA